MDEELPLVSVYPPLPDKACLTLGAIGIAAAGVPVLSVTVVFLAIMAGLYHKPTGK